MGEQKVVASKSRNGNRHGATLRGNVGQDKLFKGSAEKGQMFSHVEMGGKRNLQRKEGKKQGEGSK